MRLPTEEDLSIYTDWANHYLEKARHKRCITDLQVDITDGVLLADVIEAVTNEKVGDIRTKPRSSLQMVENINNCLIFLDKLGVNVEGLNAKEIKDGNLKAILGLFFSLSRFKQQQKTNQQQQQQHQQQHQQQQNQKQQNQHQHSQQQRQVTATSRQTSRQPGHTLQHRTASSANLNSPRNLNVNANQGEMLSRLPSPFNKPSNKCPTVTHPNSKENNSQAAATSNLHKQKSSGGYGTAERASQNNNASQAAGALGAAAKNNNSSRDQCSSRSTSPSSCASGIPKPGSRTNFSRAQSVNEKHSNRIVNSTSTSSASSLASSTKSSSKKSSSSASEKDKNSMLDKFKFFNSKEKSERSKSGSSSKSSKTHGGSSRDENDRSHGDPGGPVGSGRPSSAASRLAASGEAAASGDTGSPKLAVKSLARKSFGKGKDKKDFHREDVTSRRTPPPNAQNRISTASLSSVASSTVSSRKTSPTPSRRAASKTDKADNTAAAKSGQGSPSSGKKGSKIAGLSKSSGKTSSKTAAGQSVTGHPGPGGPGAGSHLPTSSTGIPKLGTAGKIAAKSSKEREEARNRAAPPQKEYNKSLYGSHPSGHKSSQGEVHPGGDSMHQGSHSGSATRSLQRPSNMAATVSSSSSSAHRVTSPTALHPPLTATQVGAATNNNNSLQRSNQRSSSSQSTGEKVNNVMQAEGMAASRQVDRNGNSTDVANGNEGQRSLSAQSNVGVYQQRSGASAITAMRTEKRSIQKSDGNTQTNQSHLRSQSHPQPQSSDKKPTPAKEFSNQSISSTDSANVSSATNESNNSNSNSNSNSHSSNDSVIFRPSSCDELEPGMESDANVRPFTDHISELRQKQKSQNNQNNQSSYNKNSSKSARKVETTFDAEITTETHDVENTGSSKETTFTDDTGDTIDIKPMAPIMRSTQYSYLRTLSAAAAPQKPFHIPGISVQHSHLANSASSRLGVNRPLIDPSKLYSASLKRTVSNCNNVLETDYGSDVEGYMSDIAGGYLSDGDMLRGSNYEDISSGYLSEGGASLYARRMQQRFREGMQAVKECMQKSSGIMDDDSFDDSSSISSGEISDTIAEISTDENLTGSSLSANSDHAVNPYGSLKRPPNKDKPNNLSGAALLAKTSNLLNSHKNINLDSGIPYDSGHRSNGPLSAVNWRGYASADEHGILSDTGDSDFLDGGSIDRNTYHKERNDLKGFRMQKVEEAGGGMVLGKKSNMSSSGMQTDGKKTLAIPEDPRIRNLSSQDGRDMQRPRSASPQPKKVDSEMNTDQSALLMRKMHGRASAGAGGYGLRRPLSNASNASTGSGRSANGVMRGAPSKLVRPGCIETGKNPIYENLSGLPRYKTSSSSQTYPRSGASDMGPEAYGENTLERKRRGIAGPKSSGGTSPLEEYRSNTLGRRKPDANLRERLFGSRNSLNKVQTGSGEGQSQMISSTIISNPHATYGNKHDLSGRHFSSRSSTASDCSTQSAPYANYLSPDYAPSGRPLSGMSCATAPTNWLKCSSGGTSPIGNGPFHMRSMSETESMESIASSASSLIKQARAHGLASRNILAHKDYVPIGIPRSNSIKSSQSEKNYGIGSQSDELPRTSSFSQITSPTQGPPSPTPSNSSHASSRFAYPMSLSASMGGGNADMNSSSAYGYLPLSKLGSKDDDAHGSALSLVSSSSSVYSTAEEKHSHELDIFRVIRAASIYAKNPDKEENIRKLRRELEAAQDKVATLTTQLSTNAHVVAAFEQSLSNMTSRLQHLTQTAERKDSELNDLRATIESLKQQSGHIQTFNPDTSSFSPAVGRRQTTPVRELPPTPGIQISYYGPEPPRMSRHMSNDSMSSINSLSSACSAASQQSSITDSENGKKKNKQKSKNWLRSSFSKAFSRKTPKSKNGSVSDVEPDTASLRSETGSVPNSPLLQVPHQMLNGPLKASHSSHGLSDDSSVTDLRAQLHEKDMKLTDIRLEALSSAHQLEQLRENMMRMKNEMNALKADNSRLQQLVTCKSIDGSQASAVSRSSTDSLEKRLSLGEASNIDLLLNDTSDREGRRVTISVFLGSTNESEKLSELKLPDVLIGSMAVSGKTKWDMLDSIVRRIFKEYVLRIDPVSNLGLNGESVYCYQIGEITRNKSSEVPELLPVGYLVGENMQVKLSLKGTAQNSVDSLSFEALIPKSIVQRYISLMLEHRRIILCGPSGTGKTYLAQKLAEYLVLRSGKDLTAGSIATFNVDHKSSKELRQYLSNIADQCESTSAGELPSVIILDNLHFVGSLGEVFNGFLSCKYQKCPYIIGTMNQATCSTTNLQLHHNFRWVLCANHMEPVKGFLGRYLRRKLVASEVSTGARNNDLNKIVDWMPKVWQHLNKFLETHSSSDVTIGPRLFLSCPMDVDGSQVWFTDLWNYSIVPYLLEAVREGLQLYGRRAAWEDPAEWVLETYPWNKVTDRDWPSLLRLRPEDVGYETQGVPTGGTKAAQATASDAEGDPLLNMLMRLQEAASYSSPQSQESDSTSLDSHGSGVQESPSSSSAGGSSTASGGGQESTL